MANTAKRGQSECDLSRDERNALELFRSICIQPLTSALAQLESGIDPQAPPVRDSETHLQVLELFQVSQAVCRDFTERHGSQPGLLQAARQLFLQETDPWFGRSWIAQRARTKPSGFAGDYEMLVKLYNEATPAVGIGGYIDLCILDLPLAQAVRARLAAARSFLIKEIAARNGQIRILDIASGPCREYLNWPAPNAGRQVEIVAMDNDPKALAYVEGEVANRLDLQTCLRPVRYNALRTRSSENTIDQFGRFDIIYSVGLCDYLTDEQLVRLLSAWRETLNEDGVLYIAFKDTEEYDHTPYQWHLDWYFYQRTQSDVLSLYQHAGFDLESIGTSLDQTGIITNYVFRNSGRMRRVDQASPGILTEPHLPHVREPAQTEEANS